MPSCHTCGHSFGAYKDLYSHQRATLHAYCERCHMRFPTEAALDEHERVVHYWPCGTCDKLLASAASLKNHQRSKLHSYCEDCTLFFGNEKQLEEHDRDIHHVNCDTCYEDFATEDIKKKAATATVDDATDLSSAKQRSRVTIATFTPLSVGFVAEPFAYKNASTTINEVLAMPTAPTAPAVLLIKVRLRHTIGRPIITNVAFARQNIRLKQLSKLISVLPVTASAASATLHLLPWKLPTVTEANYTAGCAKLATSPSPEKPNSAPINGTVAIASASIAT
ncbi:MAG: hypothetical protein Q9207_005304 [Kuettlingeria erythrocarpa]